MWDMAGNKLGVSRGQGLAGRLTRDCDVHTVRRAWVGARRAARLAG
jgi:hypothetical protein